MPVNHAGENKPARHEAESTQRSDRAKQAGSIEGEYVYTAGKHADSRSEQDTDFSERFGSTFPQLKANNTNQNQRETVVAHVICCRMKGTQLFCGENIF